MADTKERLAWAGLIISVVALPLGLFQETFNFRNWLGLDLKVSRQTQFTKGHSFHWDKFNTGG